MKNECQLPVVDMTLDQESELTTPVNAEHRGTASNIFKANVQSQSARVQFLLNSKQGKKNGNIAKKSQTVRVEKPHPASGILQLGPRQASLQWLLLDVSCKTSWKLFAAYIQQRKKSEN